MKQDVLKQMREIDEERKKWRPRMRPHTVSLHMDRSCTTTNYDARTRQRTGRHYTRGMQSIL